MCLAIKTLFCAKRAGMVSTAIITAANAIFFILRYFFCFFRSAKLRFFFAFSKQTFIFVQNYFQILDTFVSKMFHYQG